MTNACIHMILFWRGWPGADAIVPQFGMLWGLEVDLLHILFCDSGGSITSPCQ